MPPELKGRDVVTSEYQTFVDTVLRNDYITLNEKPHRKQAQFLMLPHLEALFGGAAGPGKSSAILMAALQYVHVPGYSALILRRSYPDLSMAGAIMDRAKSWFWRFDDVRWNEHEKTLTFPSGARIRFGFIQSENDKYKYQGAEFQFIAFDELTQFGESQYRYMFSRLRRREGVEIPLRMRVASNPGGRGHDWVKSRFITNRQGSKRIFLPARLEDNPFVDTDEYVASLAELDPITRQQLLQGDWTARESGGMFRGEWLRPLIEPQDVPRTTNRVRYWDLAATDPGPGKDPDWTVGVRLAERDGYYYVEHVARTQGTPSHVEKFIRNTAEVDGKHVPQHMEQEGGASGKGQVDHYARRVLRGFTYYPHPASGRGSKQQRANPVSSAAERRLIYLVRGDWITDFIDELDAFPYASHDDQVDALSGAFNLVAAREGIVVDSDLVGKPDDVWDPGAIDEDALY